MRFNNSLSPAAAVSRLETWSDSASEEIYIFYSPARDSDGLQILPTRSPGDYQLLFSRVYTQDSPVELLIISPPARSMYEILNNVFLDLYHPQQYLGSRLGQIVHRRNQSYHSSLSKSRVSTHFIPKQKSGILKQSIRIFFKMDMF